MSKPVPVAYTREEGGDWQHWRAGRHQDGSLRLVGPGGAVHSIKFEDGSEFDTVNGWRKPLRKKRDA